MPERPSRLSRRSALRVLTLAPALAWSGLAQAGRQVEEPLGDAVRTALSRAVAGAALDRTAIDTAGFRFGTLLDYRDPAFLPGAGKYLDLPGLLAAGMPGALWLAGEPPLLMDMGADRGDVDHVVALFRRRGLWGAISKSNSPFLRYRDPIHRSLRELAISYFPQYVKRRRKTLRTYSVPVDMRRFAPDLWLTHPGFCHEVVDALTASRHFDVLPPGAGSSDLRPIDEIEARSNDLKEFPAPG